MLMLLGIIPSWIINEAIQSFLPRRYRHFSSHRWDHWKVSSMMGSSHDMSDVSRQRYWKTAEPTPIPPLHQVTSLNFISSMTPPERLSLHTVGELHENISYSPFSFSTFYTSLKITRFWGLSRGMRTKRCEQRRHVDLYSVGCQPFPSHKLP